MNETGKRTDKSMMSSNAPLAENSSAWQALQEHAKFMSTQHMRQLFENDADRFNKFHIQLDDILLDYSKNIIDENTLQLLCQLAEQASLTDWIEAMFNGEKINHTEERAVLHTALRDRSDQTDHALHCEIQQELDRIREISEQIRNRQWLGATHRPITDIVNIGIGGSDLGPKMVTEALAPYASNSPHIHFVSNIDENHLYDTLRDLEPETTLFIVSSKSFGTLETLLNARTARKWLLKSLGSSSRFKQHFLAITAKPEAAIKFGIHPDRILRIWDWVGGRYSLWSAIGLPIAIAMGMERFEQLLEGAHEMDQHFRHAPFRQNMPVILALLGIWYDDFFNANNHAILPYDEHMKSFPAYLQQADMESNGKSVDRAGNKVNYHTGPVIFGEIGIRGQHAFYQLLHQGTQFIPADFLVAMENRKNNAKHHKALLANVFAQTEALMRGRTEQEAREEMQKQGMSEEHINSLLPYRSFDGNKPSNTLLYKTTDARTLGALIALYEHKIFVQGVIWNINSFDQWGVELGKQLANRIIDQLNDSDTMVANHDPSTNALINHYKKFRSVT